MQNLVQSFNILHLLKITLSANHLRVLGHVYNYTPLTRKKHSVILDGQPYALRSTLLSSKGDKGQSRRGYKVLVGLRLELGPI